MPTYSTRRGAYSYGHAVGILLLDAKAPFIPGDVANATSYDFPVIYKTVEGLSTSVCLNGAPEFNEKLAEAAKELAREGVKGISSDCGFMLQFQEAVADAVDIPVCMSSLLQLPFIARSLDPSQPIGVITADSTNLDEGFLTRGGVKLPPNPLIIRGMQDEPEFKTAVLEEKGSLDSDLITAETVACAEKLLAEYPTMGAILLECSMLPPYAKAVQDAVGLPVYDFISAIDYLSAGMRPRAYTGGY
ncbi:MAG: aspartate/glutamate racemase family protein [Proteobacteria bacterium]|nr:aspartate/glutamate racemase family protein [Pseudomonadota bacterium]